MEIVNPVDPDDLVGWSATLRTTFLQGPDPDEDIISANRWRDRLTPGRTWGAREDGRWVATLATDARRLTVPGSDSGARDLVIDALTAVTVNATHRRRGLLSTMLGQALDAAKDRGDALSYLIAAEWPIYGRFGYAPAVRYANYSYLTRSPGATIAPGPGHLRQAGADEILETAPALYERCRLQRAGEIDRSTGFWPMRFDGSTAKSRHNLIVHEGPEGVDGVLAWQPRRDFELDASMGSIEVTDLFAATPEAYRNLWSYLSGVDVIDEATLRGRPVDEPARWLLADGRALRQTYAGDVTWVCLLDVPAALTARGYGVAGSLVLEVLDPSTHGYAAGRYALDAGPDGATCERTTGTPDLTLTAAALASAYLGGYRLAGRAAVGDVTEHTTGSLRRLDAMLSTPLAPNCGTGF